MTKPCNYCDSDEHKSWQCFDKPRNTPTRAKSINKFGKKAAKWMETRNQWLQDNPPMTYETAEKGWRCHYCSKFIVFEELTIDHKIPRSGLGAQYQYEPDNLVACCYADNRKKGSIQYDAYCAEFYPHLLTEQEEIIV